MKNVNENSKHNNEIPSILFSSGVNIQTMSQLPLDDINQSGSVGRYILDKNKDELDKIETRTRCRNYIYHMEQIRDIYSDENEISFGDGNLEKDKLKKEWLGEIDQISPEEKILSAIWKGWLVELNENSNHFDYKIYLEKMKMISSAEAEYLLYTARYPIFSVDFKYMKRSNSGKAKFLQKQLLEKELIEKDNFYLKMLLLSTVTLSLLILAVTFNSGFDLFRYQSMFLFMFIIVIGTFFIISYLARILLLRRYRLTWIGAGIVRMSSLNSKLDL